MAYCRKCGAKLDEDARYCPSCGTPVGAYPTTVQRGEGLPGFARILLLIFGGIVLLVAFGLFVGGGSVFWINSALTDNQGFITTRSQQVGRDSYAIALQDINIEWNLPPLIEWNEWRIWRPSPGDLVTIKLTASSTDPSKKVFIGIARANDLAAYLGNVKYDEITHFSISPSGYPLLEYTTHPGVALPSPPTSKTIWVVSQHGAGTQTLEWSPEPGTYWIVLMNEDGSIGVDLTMTLGAKVPLLSTIAIGLLVGGLIAGLMGAALIYLGVRR